MVKPERAKMVEDHLIRLARSGSLKGRVDENTIKSLLTQVSEQTGGKTKVIVRYFWIIYSNYLKY
jgi:DNA-binding TFAR19-related protein (PDSD5 family)